MNKPQELPPKWVKFFSWCFAYLTIIPMMIVIQVTVFRETYGLSSFGFSLETDGNLLKERIDLLPFLLVLAGIIFLGGLTGIFILTWRSFAYKFGIVYCSCAFVAISYGKIVNMPSSDDDGTIQYLLLICFMVHLIRHRRLWEQTVANKRQARPLAAPESNFIRIQTYQREV